MRKRMESTVFGRVQLVMYRDFIKRNARRLGLAGWVRNNPDGTVSIQAEGESEQLEKLLVCARRGSLLARVDRLETRWVPVQSDFSRFMIVY